MIYLFVFVGVYCLHVLLKLNWITTAVIGFYLLVMSTFHKKRYRMQKDSIRRFNEAVVYMDTLLYAFLKERKIIRAFEDVYSTLNRSDMKDLVGECLEHMSLAYDEPEFLEKSMNQILARFNCRRIKNIHDYMLHVEYYGGAIEESISILLEDKNSWEIRINKVIAERKKMLGEIIMSVFMSVIICGMIIYIPVLSVDISGNTLTQILTAVVIVLDDLIIYRAQKYLIEDWLKLDVFKEDEYYEKKIKEFYARNDKKQLHFSMRISVVPVMIIVVGIICGKQLVIIIGMLAMLVTLNQHRIGRYILQKNIRANIRSVFPKWLMDMILLMQSENVQVSLSKSQELVPGVLKYDLKRLVERLKIDPESSHPYHEFLHDFEMPEIHSAMSILYGISIGNDTNSGGQIKELITRNLAMMDEADTVRLKNKSSGMYLLFLAPVLTASFKLLVDMALFLLSFMRISAV